MCLLTRHQVTKSALTFQRYIGHTNQTVSRNYIPCPKWVQYKYHIIKGHGYLVYYYILKAKLNTNYTILYYTILCYGILYYTVIHYTLPYHTIPYITIPCHTILYHTIPYHAIPYHNITYYTTTLCYAMLWYAMVCCTMK